MKFTFYGTKEQLQQFKKVVLQINKTYELMNGLDEMVKLQVEKYLLMELLGEETDEEQ